MTLQRIIIVEILDETKNSPVTLGLTPNITKKE